jgi:hypothetical protein
VASVCPNGGPVAWRGKFTVGVPSGAVIARGASRRGRGRAWGGAAALNG